MDDLRDDEELVGGDDLADDFDPIFPGKKGKGKVDEDGDVEDIDDLIDKELDADDEPYDDVNPW